MADRGSFDEFVAGRYRALVRTAFLLTGNLDDAEDLVQSALVKAVPRWRRIQSPEAYVRRSIVNAHVSRWRRHRGRELLVALPPERADRVRDPDTTLVLARALATLATRQRAVVVLRYFEDLTEAQTAETLGIAVGTVKSQARAALARLREVLPVDGEAAVAEPVEGRP